MNAVCPFVHRMPRHLVNIILGVSGMEFLDEMSFSFGVVDLVRRMTPRIWGPHLVSQRPEQTAGPSEKSLPSAIQLDGSALPCGLRLELGLQASGPTASRLTLQLLDSSAFVVCEPTLITYPFSASLQGPDSQLQGPLLSQAGP